MIIPYLTNIETQVIEQIASAEKSIHIVVAWFTNVRIINALTERLRQCPDLSVQIVVDDNETNRLYFFSKIEAMQQAGITIRKQINRQFLHHKFIVIDEQRLMLGSYNFTEKANTNRENFNLLEEPIVARFFVRQFEMITNPDYLDENIYLLLNFPEFAQKIVSANFPFSNNDLKKYRTRITVGHCFTADNGHYDALHYEPGFIFNPICKPVKHEFSLPIRKAVMEDWHFNLAIEFGRNYYYDFPDNHDDLGNYMQQNLDAITEFYKRKFKDLYPLRVLEEKIMSKVNIVIEDQLWPVNFYPFFNARVLDKVMNALPDLSQDYCWQQDNHLISRIPKKKV